MGEKAEQKDKYQSGMHYGDFLRYQIQNIQLSGPMDDFRKFVLNRGWEFSEPESLYAAYNRLWKSQNNIVLKKEEFLAEVGNRDENRETANRVYTRLLQCVERKMLTASDLYQYARFKWCLRNPDAIIGYRVGKEEWAVNNCDVKVSESKAKILIGDEWGFNVGKIKIIGPAFYDVTDWQFIRFDAEFGQWLWKNGELYKVFL